MNREQKNTAWQRFAQTGTVEAYLHYKQEPQNQFRMRREEFGMQSKKEHS